MFRKIRGGENGNELLKHGESIPGYRGGRETAAEIRPGPGEIAVLSTPGDEWFLSLWYVGTPEEVRANSRPGRNVHRRMDAAGI
jgi:hypothetical protein